MPCSRRRLRGQARRGLCVRLGGVPEVSLTCFIRHERGIVVLGRGCADAESVMVRKTIVILVQGHRLKDQKGRSN